MKKAVAWRLKDELLALYQATAATPGAKYEFNPKVLHGQIRISDFAILYCMYVCREGHFVTAC